jgi:hypothetical protein
VPFFNSLANNGPHQRRETFRIDAALLAFLKPDEGRVKKAA